MNEDIGVSFPVFLLVMVATFAAISCLLRGFYHFCVDIADVQLKLKEKKLNRAPDTNIDRTIRLLTKNLQREADNEFCTTAEGHRNEIIRSEDGRISISQYHHPDYMEIDIKTVGKFRASKLKPEVAKELSRVCLAFKDYIATVAILEPHRLETRAIKEET